MKKDLKEIIEYYTSKSNDIKNYINTNSNLSTEDIIDNAKALEILEYKLTALEAAASV